MKITIERDGEHLTNAEVADLSAVPECVFACSKHFGGGEFIARVVEAHDGIKAGEALYRLEAAWLEGDEA